MSKYHIILFHISVAHTQSIQKKQKAKQHKTIENKESTSIQTCSDKEHLNKTGGESITCWMIQSVDPKP